MDLLRKLCRAPALVLALLAGLALSLAPAHVAHAATISVTTTADELNQDGDCSLREAIRAANLDMTVGACPAGSGADALRLPAGTYTLAIPGRDEDEAATGDLDVSGTLTLTGAGASATIIDANHIDRILEVRPASNVTLAQVTLQHGQAEAGGGIFSQSTLTLSHTTINANTATSPSGDGYNFGGGIYNFGTLSIDNSKIVGNQAYGYGTSGGGISTYGPSTVSNSVITGNSTSGRFHGGGGIESSNSLTVLNSLISENSSGGGGGILTYGTALLTTTAVISNSATGGGGISNQGTLTLTNSTISGNQVGAGYDPFSFSDHPGVGGGIANGGMLFANTSTISNNRATGTFYWDPLQEIEVFVPAYGGGISSGGLPASVMLWNTVVAGNTATTSGSDCSGTLISQGYNLIQESEDCTLTGETATTFVGRNPLLGPLQNNGGPTPTHALLPGSPAIDAGNSAAPGSGVMACQASDQRGIPRPQDGNGDGSAHCDIGAYEVAATVAIVGMDIKPGSTTNTINLKSNGVIPVALLTTSNFDATQVDPLGVRFGPSGAREAHGRGHLEDVDRDGDLDLVLHFRTRQTGLHCGMISASLTGTTKDRQSITGSDSISLTGCR